MTVWEHLAFTASAYRLKDFEKDAEALLASFELTHKRDTLVSNLSRGMRQKVAIACAFLHNPKVLLFDEPLTVIDPHLKWQLRSKLKELHQQIGVTMIYVTHDQVEAMTLASRIVVLANKGIAQVGRYLIRVFDMVSDDWEVTEFSDKRLVIAVRRCPLTSQIFQDGSQYAQTFRDWHGGRHTIGSVRQGFRWRCSQA